MRVEITKLTTWADVLNSARFTQRKDLFPRDFEPSDDFKRKIIRAEHSPLRCLMFFIELYDIPYYAAMHFRTHKLIHAPFVSTSRPDIDGNQKPRNEQLKDEPVNMRLMLDAQELIAISKVRLCRKAERETRNIWQSVINKLYTDEPLLATACIPSCVYRGFCPELKSCGYIESKNYDLAREEYCNVLV